MASIFNGHSAGHAQSRALCVCVCVCQYSEMDVGNFLGLRQLFITMGNKHRVLNHWPEHCTTHTHTHTNTPSDTNTHKDTLGACMAPCSPWSHGAERRNTEACCGLALEMLPQSHTHTHTHTHTQVYTHTHLHTHLHTHKERE